MVHVIVWFPLVFCHSERLPAPNGSSKLKQSLPLESPKYAFSGSSRMEGSSQNVENIFEAMETPHLLQQHAPEIASVVTVEERRKHAPGKRCILPRYRTNRDHRDNSHGEKQQQARTGRGPDAGRTIQFKVTDADPTRTGRAVSPRARGGWVRGARARPPRPRRGWRGAGRRRRKRCGRGRRRRG
eukprot:gene19812-biopygen10062